MYTLRKIIDNTQTNHNLGHQYQVVERDVNYDEFSRLFKASFGYNHVTDSDPKADNYTTNCYAFIVTQDFKDIPLYKKQHNYVMTEAGKTFSNLTYKD